MVRDRTITHWRFDNTSMFAEPLCLSATLALSDYLEIFGRCVGTWPCEDFFINIFGVMISLIFINNVFHVHFRGRHESAVTKDLMNYL